MDVIDALCSRHSVRAYQPKPLDKETLQKIMAAALNAPSWANTQPWEVFIAGGESLNRLREGYRVRLEQGVPSDPDVPRPPEWPSALQQRMAENTAHRQTVMGVNPNDEEVRKASMRRNYSFFGAPVVVYLCMDRRLTSWSIFDMGSVAQSIMLAAQEFGVGSVPAISLVAYPDLIRSELAIPNDLLVLFGLALGYEDETNVVNKPRSLRRTAQEVVRFVGF